MGLMTKVLKALFIRDLDISPSFHLPLELLIEVLGEEEH